MNKTKLLETRKASNTSKIYHDLFLVHPFFGLNGVDTSKSAKILHDAHNYFV